MLFNLKVQEEKYALRMENERMLEENMLMKEVLKNQICPTCRNHADHEHYTKQFRLENAHLKQEAS